MASVSSIPIELYRPIVEFVEDCRDLLTLCLVCRAMRDEAERILYSVVELTTATQSVAIQLNSNQRQRRHIQHLSIATLSIRYAPDVLATLLGTLPASLATLNLFDAQLGLRFYVTLSECYFPRLKEFTCTSRDTDWIPEDIPTSATALANQRFITFLENHPTIEKLFWKGRRQQISNGKRIFVPETLPRLRLLDAAAVLVVPLLGPRSITHLSVQESHQLPPLRYLTSMVQLIAFECHETSSDGPLMEILSLAPQLKFFGTVYIGYNYSVSFTVNGCRGSDKVSTIIATLRLLSGRTWQSILVS